MILFLTFQIILLIIVIKYVPVSGSVKVSWFDKYKGIPVKDATLIA